MINRFKDFNNILSENLDLSENDLNGGLTNDEFSDVLRKVSELYSNRNELSDDEKVLTEILFNMLTKPERGYNYDTYYHRRIGFIENNKNKKK